MAEGQAPILRKLQETCNEILDQVLNCPVGAATLQMPRVWGSLDFDKATKLRHRLCELLQKRDRLRALLLARQRDARISAAAGTGTTDLGCSTESLSQREDELLHSIQSLQEELFWLATKRRSQELVLHRIYSAPIAHAYVFEKQEKELGPPLPGSESENLRQVKLSLVQRDNKVSALLLLHSELAALNEQIHGCETDCIALQQKNRELIATYDVLLAKKEKRKQTSATPRPTVHSELQTEVDRLHNENVLLRIIFKTLILESGENWARNDELKHVMLHDTL